MSRDEFAIRNRVPRDLSYPVAIAIQKIRDDMDALAL
jgi:hypothetical protein